MVAKNEAKGFTAEERAAMRERAREMKTQAGKADGEREVRAKIAAMPAKDRAMAERFHAIVKANAPALVPRTWYGMPAYAKDGVVLCFFKAASKFKERYASIGFNENANLDEGNMWPIAYALKELAPAEEARIAGSVKKAAS
jgi:uncharacterized protein YdhG (YjbR/CyaY superfamily)